MYTCMLVDAQKRENVNARDEGGYYNQSSLWTLLQRGIVAVEESTEHIEKGIQTDRCNQSVYHCILLYTETFSIVESGFYHSFEIFSLRSLLSHFNLPLFIFIYFFKAHPLNSLFSIPALSSPIFLCFAALVLSHRRNYKHSFHTKSRTGQPPVERVPCELCGYYLFFSFFIFIYFFFFIENSLYYRALYIIYLAFDRMNNRIDKTKFFTKNDIFFGQNNS